MAGSYDHITHAEGGWKGVKTLDNMGDAEEALYHCWLMIQILSQGDLSTIGNANNAAINIRKQEST
jgi:hypothetical protein